MLKGTLAKRIEPHDLLALFSVEVPRLLPTLSKCPVCGTPVSLEVSWGYQHNPAYWCRNPECWFIGDGLALYRAVTHKPLKEACYELIAERVLPRDGDLDREIQEYESEMDRYQRRVFSIWEQANRTFRQAPSAVAGLLQGFRCWSSAQDTCGVGSLGHHLGALRGSEIQGLPGIPKHIAQHIKVSQHYLVMPLWLDRWVISGFAFFGSQNQHYHWDIFPERVCGVGMVHTAPMNQSYLLGCSSPVHAIQTHVHGVVNACRVPVVYLAESSTSWPYLVAQRRIMVNVNRSALLYRAALPFPECQILTENDLEALQAIQHPEARLQHALTLGYPTFRALAVYLLGLPRASASSVLPQLDLQASDVQRVLSACPEHARDQLDALFRQTVAAEIKYRNDHITCTEEGWVSAKHGKISNTTFFVDQIIVDTTSHQGTATGTVIQGRREFRFSSPVQDLEHHTQEWLQNILAENRAGWLEVQPGWASRLFAISRMFKAPTTHHMSNAVGWVEGNARLVLPGLLVEAGQVSLNPHPVQGVCCGTGLVRIEPSAAQLSGWVEDDEAGHMFWALFALLSSNLLSPFHRHGTFGIGVVDRQNGLLGQVVRDMVEQVGLERVTFRNTGQAKMQEIWRQEQRSPLPLYIEETWAANEGFAKWLSNKQTRNCVVAMSNPVAIGTCLDGGWAYLKSSSPASPGQASRMLQAWNLLPDFIAFTQTRPIEWPAIRSGAMPAIFESLQAWLVGKGLEPRVLRAAQSRIELDMLERTSSWGSKFLSLLIETIESGLIMLKSSVEQDIPQDCVVADYAGEVVFISRATLVRLMGQLGLPAPPHQQVVSMLQASKALAGTRYRDVSGYAIPLEQWSLYYSLRGTR